MSCRRRNDLTFLPLQYCLTCTRCIQQPKRIFLLLGRNSQHLKRHSRRHAVLARGPPYKCVADNYIANLTHNGGQKLSV